MKIYKRCILQEDYSVLPECCKKRINSKKNRIQSAAAYLLLRDALKENGKDINNISFLETGKPVMPDCFISIAHSGELAVCCISEKQTGIDAERLRRIEKRKKYYFFTERENQYVNSGDNADLNFLIIWTMKEAYKKAEDCSWLKLKDICFVGENGKPLKNYNSYSFKTECSDGYIITLCEKISGS